MSQTSLTGYAEVPEKAGLLPRHSDEKRVDELPELIEQNPDTAVYAEKVTDCAFPFLANAYGAVDVCPGPGL